MNNLYKLRDICNMYNLSRRVIQGYEKEGLISHTSKTKQGYLLYDEKTVKKIAIIRFLQTYDSLKNINEYLNNEASKFKEGINKYETLIPVLIKRETKNLEIIKSINKANIKDTNYIDKTYNLIKKKVKK